MRKKCLHSLQRESFGNVLPRKVSACADQNGQICNATIVNKTCFQKADQGKPKYLFKNREIEKLFTIVCDTLIHLRIFQIRNCSLILSIMVLFTGWRAVSGLSLTFRGEYKLARLCLQRCDVTEGCFNSNDLLFAIKVFYWKATWAWTCVIRGKWFGMREWVNC